MTAQTPDLTPRKWPSQERSRATFEAMVTACTRLLPERGYVGTTTNHIAARAGVNIASLYEYFPGKDAVIAQVAERLVDRVLRRLAEGSAGVLARGESQAVRLWIELVHDTVARERDLVAVFHEQVPYTRQLPAVRDLGPRLLEFSRRIGSNTGDLRAAELSTATLHLTINLVTSTILQLILHPPDDVSRRELLDELIDRLDTWVRNPDRSAPSRTTC